MDTPLPMELQQARAAIAEIFGQNGFTAWSQQARVETDVQQLRRLAIRAVNTTPAARRPEAYRVLIPLLA